MERVFSRLRRKKDKEMDTSTTNRRPPLSHQNPSAGKKRRSKRDSMFSFISSLSSSEKEGGQQRAPKIETETEIERRDAPSPLRDSMTAGALPAPRTPNPEEEAEEAAQEIETEEHVDAIEATHRIENEVDMSAQEMPPSPTTTTAPSNLYQQPNLQGSTNSFSSTTSTLRGEPLSPLPFIPLNNQARPQNRHHSTRESFTSHMPQNRHSIAGTGQGMNTFALQQRLQEREERIANAWLKAEERRRRSMAWPADPWRGGFGPPSSHPSLVMPGSYGREFVGYGYFGMSGVGLGNGGVGPGFGGRAVPFNGATYGNSGAGAGNRHSIVSTRSTASGTGASNGGAGVSALRGGVREWLGRRTSVREGAR